MCLADGVTPPNVSIHFPEACALQEIPLSSAYLVCCRCRAAATRHRIGEDDSSDRVAERSLSGTRPTLTCMSILSASGPDIRRAYRSTSFVEHEQTLVPSPSLPQGHGFVVPTRV